MTADTYTYDPTIPYCAPCHGTGSVRHSNDTFTPCTCRPEEAHVNHADSELRRLRAQRDDLLAALVAAKNRMDARVFGRQKWTSADQLTYELVAAAIDRATSADRAHTFGKEVTP